MIYKFIKSLSNVTSFEAKSGYYLKKDKVKTIFNESIDIRLEDCKKIKKFGKDIIIIDKLNKPYVLNDNQINYELTSVFRISTLKFPYIDFYKKETPRLYGIYDYHKILFETKDWIGRNIIGEYVIGEYQGVISCRSIYSDSILWQFPLSHFGKFVSDCGEERDYEIEQFIGVYNNILWLKLSLFSGGLIGLDVETGELKYQLEGIKKENLNGVVDSYLDTDKHYVFYSTHFHLLEDGRIIGLAGDRFYEVDLNKEIIEPKLYGLWEKMKNLDIDKGNISYNTIFCNGLLYFILHDQHKFGIFDIETMKISYVSDKIETADNQEARSQLKDLKVSEDKLYILDSAQTLHIFEKENHI